MFDNFFLLFSSIFSLPPTMLIYNAIIFADNEPLHLISFLPFAIECILCIGKQEDRPLGSIHSTCIHVSTEGNHNGFLNRTISFHCLFIFLHSSHGRVDYVRESPLWNALNKSNKIKLRYDLARPLPLNRIK